MLKSQSFNIQGINELMRTSLLYFFIYLILNFINVYYRLFE